MKPEISTEKFLKKFGLYHHDIEIEHYINLFINDMVSGLEGGDSSLKMIPTYIEFKEKLKTNKNIIAIDAGGTNLRIALIRFNEDNKIFIEDLKTYKMPGSENEIESSDFFKIIADCINPIIDKADTISFCFSYPAEIHPDRDGRVLSLSKEIKVSNITNKFIGKNLSLHLNKKKRIIIVNDTVTALLAGSAINSHRIYDSYISLILGTGTNSAYIENNAKIGKLNCLKGYQIINTESGGFLGINQGVIDRDFDGGTSNPGSYLLEKMISGKYLGALLKKTLDYAVNEGLFTDSFADHLNSIKNILTEDISNFLNNPYHNIFVSHKYPKYSENDLSVLYYLIDNFIERIAVMNTIVLSSIAIKIDKGHNPFKPLCIVVEGSTFYRIKGLKFKTEYHLLECLQRRHKIFFELSGIDNASLIGAAIAGLNA